MKILFCDSVSFIDTKNLDLQAIQDYLIILEKDSWDDFGYKVTFNLFIQNVNDMLSTQRKIGQLKIAKEGQVEHNFSDISEYEGLASSLADELPSSFYSLGEGTYYYQNIKNYFNDPVLEFRLISKLKDIEKNKKKLEDLKNETIFDKAFKRTATYADKIESDWFNHISEPKSVFDRQIQSVQALLSSEATFDTQVLHGFNAMLFGYTIAAMENYLFTVFSKKVNSDEMAKRKYLKSLDKKGLDKKITLSEIQNDPNFIENKLNEALGKISFHNVATSKDLFSEVLQHHLLTNEQSNYFIEKIEIRHDCAHRGGYDKEGNLTPIGNAMIEELIVKITEVVDNVEQKVTY